MAARKRLWNKQCPFCFKDISYWPNCSPRTSSDYWDVAWTETKRGTRQFFHKSCYYADVTKNKEELT